MAGGFGNLAEVIDQLERYGEGFIDGAFKAAYREAEAVATLSRDTYCPVDTGALRSTYRLVADLENIHLASIDIQVGGADSIAPYAVFVHEDLSKFHQSPTQAKFLQRAVDEIAPTMTVRIGEGAVSSGKARAQ